MKFTVLKRKIKSRLNGKSSKKKRSAGNNNKVSIFFVSSGVLAFFLLVFCIVQLLVASVLSPRGKELKRLDSEKEILLEENRKLEQEIAQYSSISLIKNRATSQLEMERAEKVIYVDELVAENESKRKDLPPQYSN